MLEADFQQHYHLDLSKAIYGGKPLSVRRLTVLIGNLPTSSRTVRAEVGYTGHLAEWTQETLLLGMLAEQVDALIRTTVKANGGKVRGKPLSVVPRVKTPERHLRSVDTATALSGLDDVLAGAVA